MRLLCKGGLHRDVLGDGAHGRVLYMGIEAHGQMMHMGSAAHVVMMRMGTDVHRIVAQWGGWCMEGKFYSHHTGTFSLVYQIYLF